MPYPGDNCSIASVLTAAAPGAVAVIRVQAAESAATRAFKEFRRADRRSPLDAEQGRLLYGSWNSEDLIVVRTADATWEIHCHGGPVAQQRILQDLAAAGIQIDPVNRETPLADDAHSDDAQIVTTAIQQALQNSRTREAANRILQQSDGRLLQLRRDLRSADPSVRQQALGHVQKWSSFAEHLTSAFQITLIGPPNAGKSSLLNALTGRNRAIVSATPGTTRDIVEAETVADGWLLRIRDCAGIRDHAETLPEQLGILKARSSAESSDLICMVTDEQEPVWNTQLAEIEQASGCPVLMIQSKSDLRCGSQSRSQPSASIGRLAEVSVSAHTGAGLSELRSIIVQRLVPELPEAMLPLPIPGSCTDLLTKPCR